MHEAAAVSVEVRRNANRAQAEVEVQNEGGGEEGSCLTINRRVKVGTHNSLSGNTTARRQRGRREGGGDEGCRKGRETTRRERVSQRGRRESISMKTARAGQTDLCCERGKPQGQGGGGREVFPWSHCNHVFTDTVRLHMLRTVKTPPGGL